MQPKTQWQFSCPLNEVDVARIFREAGPRAKCVRFTIDGKTYTGVNPLTAEVFPTCRPIDHEACKLCDERLETRDGYRYGENDTVSRGDSGQIFIQYFPTEGQALENEWILYTGDRVGEVVDRVETLVEVF